MNDPLGLFEDTADKDPLGLFDEAPKKKASLGTAIHVANEQAANALDRFGTGLYGAAVNLFDTDKADAIFRNMDKRTAGRLAAANPDNEEIGLGGKLAGAVATLPVQLAAMPFSPADTGQTMLRNGETLPRALAGAGIDTAGNAIGMAIPGGLGGTVAKRIGTGAAMNAAQDLATKQAISSISEQQATKDELGPNMDSAIVSAVLGGAMGALPHQRASVEPTVKLEEAAVKNDPLGLFGPERQMELPFDNGVETIAAKQMEGQPQLDMFSPEAEQHRNAIEAQRGAQMQREAALEVPVDRPSPDIVQRQLDDMWNQRQRSVEQATPEVVRQQRQEKADEARNSREDMLMQLEDELRAGAYGAPDYLDVRTGRGRVPRSQRGAIDVGSDLDTIKQRFSKFNVEVEPIKFGNNDTIMVRLKTPDGKLAGFVDFAVREDGVLTAENAQVAGGLQGKGAAQRMYMAAREAGFDIAPGRVQTDAGKKMVARLQDRGLINKDAVGPRFDAGDLNLVPLAGERLPGERYVPRSQRGGIDFQGVSEGLKKIFSKEVQKETRGPVRQIVGKSMIPVDPAPADVVKRALAEGKDTNAYNFTRNTASGATLETMTRKSALLDGVAKTVQNAVKRADLLTQKTVFPVEKQLRGLSAQQLVNLGEVFKKEMFGRRQFTAEELHKAGLSEREMEAYADLRDLFHDTMDIQNQAREKLGLEPISEKEYYFSSRWQGDFRQPVRDKEGRLVWYLAANSRLGLEKQAKALKKQFPDLVIDPKQGHMVKTSMGKNELQSMYSTMLDVLGRDNPEVQKLKEALEESVAIDAASSQGQQKHFERKANIRGFVGDRPGTELKSEAQAAFQQQIQYAKNAYKWASLQEAGSKLKEVFSNEELAAQQPKNMEMAKDYFQNNVTGVTAKWVAGIEDAFRSLGVSPSVVQKAVGSTKSFFITQKLAASLGYTAANLLQITATVPHMLDSMVKQGANPIKGYAVGLPLGLLMATEHYGNAIGKIKEMVPEGEQGFYKQAFKYAEDNGVTARSIYDEAPIGSSQILKAVGKTMSVPETYVRSMAFMSYVAALKNTKEFKGKNMALFQKAEELVNASMVDYRAGERPMAFAKLGTLGDALNTLQTYPINLMNQYRYFGKEAAKGNIVPFVGLLATQVAMAGAMGIPGFNDMDKVWQFVKKQLPDSVWEKVKDFDPKMWIMDNLGESALYGALSTETGVSMTGRLSAPGLSDMAVSPAAPVMDMAKQAGAWANLAVDPNSTNLAQAVRNTTPTGLQGLVETNLFRDENVAADRPDGTALYKKATDLEDRQGQYARTPKEEALRAMGLRSQREVVSNELNYKIGEAEQQVNERSKGLVEKFYSAVRRGDMKKAESLNALYTRLNGKAISNEQMETQLMEEYTTAIERSTTTLRKLEAVKGAARLRDMMEKRDAAYGR